MINITFFDLYSSNKQLWHAPSIRAKERYKHGEPLYKIMGITPMKEGNKPFKPPKFDILTAEKKARLQKLMFECGNTKSPLYKLVSMKAGTVVEPPKPTLQSFIKDMCFVEEMPKLFNTKVVNDLRQDELDHYHNNNCCYTNIEKAIRLCELTMKQGSCKEWKEIRNNFITGSKASKIYHAQKKRPGYLKTLMNYFHDSSDKSEGPYKAQLYGLQNEPKARSTLEKLLNTKIYEAGLCVKAKHPWLAASPDGLFIKDGILSLCEIKCPQTCEFTDKVDMPYLMEDKMSGKKVLNRYETSHGKEYYMQMQITMYCTNAKQCHFFVWNQKDYVHDIIPFNEKFI